MTTTETLAGGVAVITGAAGGLGAGFTHAAADAGMTVIAVDVMADRLDDFAADVRAKGGKVFPYVVNVADACAVEALAKNVHDQFGDVRLLINNAAVETLGRIWEVPAEVWQRTFSINVLGIANGIRAFLPKMIECGRPAYISNVASSGMLGVLPTHGVYIATKAAIFSMTETLYLDLEPLGKPIHVSAVIPHAIASRIIQDAFTTDAAKAEAAETAKHLVLGMDPMTAGRIALDGIASGAFWVSSHPDEVAPIARERGARFTQMDRPKRTNEMPPM
jgi:NAD(P)-dependent dehydrogenase (short-subunit alcohol dehydrogenase family)